MIREDGAHTVGTRDRHLSAGLRAETIERASRAIPARRSIVALGDSIVYGWGVSYDQSFPCVLERLLAQQEPRGEIWRVINAGIPGDTSVMGCLRYRQDVASLGPEIALISFGLNDAMLRRTRFDAQRERIWRAQSSLIHRLPYMLKRRLSGGAKHISPGEVNCWDLPRVSKQVFGLALRELVSSAREHKARPYLMTLVPALPIAAEERQQDLWQDYDQVIRQVARQTETPCIELYDLHRNCGERAYAADGLHLTAFGHAWIAKQACQCLKEALL